MEINVEAVDPPLLLVLGEVGNDVELPLPLRYFARQMPVLDVLLDRKIRTAGFLIFIRSRAVGILRIVIHRPKYFTIGVRWPIRPNVMR